MNLATIKTVSSYIKNGDLIQIVDYDGNGYIGTLEKFEKGEETVTIIMKGVQVQNLEIQHEYEILVVDLNDVKLIIKLNQKNISVNTKS